MEYLDICNEKGMPTGEVIARDIAHRDGILHRTAHLWIVREVDGRFQVLMQKRSMEKESFPGLYDTSSAGHIPAGVEPLPSALRELSEELGIDAGPEQLQFAGFFRIEYEKVFHGKPFHDNEAVWVYVYRDPVEITQLKLQKSEVESVSWFDLDDVWTETRTSRDRFCAPSQGLEVLRKYLGTA